MWSETPAARGSGETWSADAKWHVEGWGVVDGGGGRACNWGTAAHGAGEYSFVHPFHVAIHCVGSHGGALVLFAGAGARAAGVVVVDITTMRVAVVPVLKTFDD